MKRVAHLVSFLSIAIVLLTLNRKTNVTQGLLQPFDFLRWQDFHAMVSLPVIITVLYTLLFIQITRRRSKVHTYFGFFLTLFAVGALFYGISSGNHEITNYLHHRNCMGSATSICKIIQFNDDTFSHFLFYISSILMTVALLLFEFVQPESKPASKIESGILLVNAGLIGVGLFANLAFERLGIDLYAFGILSAISVTLLWMKRKNLGLFPIITYCALGYGSGTLASFVYKVLMI